MIAWQGPGDDRFSTTGGNDSPKVRHTVAAPTVDRVPWLPETRDGFLELLTHARGEHHQAQLDLARLTRSYQSARDQGGDPLDLLVLRVDRALAADAVRTWAVEVDGLFDVMAALDMNPPTNGAQP